jgi:hypothetical protein
MPETPGFQYIPTLDEYLGAFGYASLDDVPTAEIMVPRGAACREYCRIWAERVPASFAEYLSFTPVGSGYEQRYVPMMIDLLAYPDWPSFEVYVKGFGKGQRPRMAQRAERNGFYVKPFHWNLFLPDIYEINTSKDTRSGGAMTANYRRTVEEMGGPPTAYREPAAPQCPLIWDQQFGVFRAEPGHQQGEVMVDERLLGYVSLRRYGNFAMYSMILGHGDYLAEGVMVLLHLKIVRWLIEQRSDPVGAGVRYLFYGGMQNGTAGLFQWKRLAGFRPYRVFCAFADCPQQPQG